MLLAMNDLKCTHCGATGLEAGFLDIQARGSSGAWLRWASGPFERGLFGAKKSESTRFTQVHAYRCPKCAHVDLFARG